MKKLRRRLLAKQYKCKYNRYSDGFWSLKTLNNSYGCGRYSPLSDSEFKEMLKKLQQYM